MAQGRSSGIILHITSLPSLGGIGDFGPAAYEFADFLQAAKQRVWQVLPLSPTGYGNSPYAATSAFAGNSLLISLEKLADDGWIDHDRLRALDSKADAVDYAAVAAVKLPLLEEAARNLFSAGAKPAMHGSVSNSSAERSSIGWMIMPTPSCCGVGSAAPSGQSGRRSLHGMNAER